MELRFKIALPAIAASLTAILTGWDIQNWRVIESMGMAWDTGAPVWPFQAPDILLRLLNLPAYFIGMPLVNWLGLTAPIYHFIVFPASLVWWWLVGSQLYRWRMKRPSYRKPVSFASRFLFSALLVVVASIDSMSAFRWWFQYGGNLWGSDIWGMVRLLTPPLWCLVFACAVAFAARRAPEEE